MEAIQDNQDKVSENVVKKEKSKTHSTRPTCPICYNPITATIKTIVVPCFHTFCYHCIVHWIKQKAICPICKESVWLLLYSIKSDNDYKIITIRKNNMNLECEIYTPHLFINDKGEYECTISETNRIRERLGLNPLEQ